MLTIEQENVLKHLFTRYKNLIEWNGHELAHLPIKCDGNSMSQLCTEAINNTSAYPFDKLCRWLGFVQGVLAVKCIIRVDEERDYTRPLFHGLSSEPVPSFGTD